jgi:hypothetical protein
MTEAVIPLRHEMEHLTIPVQSHIQFCFTSSGNRFFSADADSARPVT